MKFIGIDVHKRIHTACIPDDSEKLVGEPNDIPTALEGLQRLTEPYPPEDCSIVFENLGRAHFVKRVLNDMGYSLEAAHTGHGAMISPNPPHTTASMETMTTKTTITKKSTMTTKPTMTIKAAMRTASKMMTVLTRATIGSKIPVITR
ncbi:hypothetical protein [Methanomethylophilus alvi]|uniref:hypothetical protein n=1 Tax=Methanomethylophilus alvi TaxID=1291540 RepID=UPI0037DC3740